MENILIDINSKKEFKETYKQLAETSIYEILKYMSKKFQKKFAGVLEILIVDKQEIQKVNNKWRKINKPTNVISLQGDFSWNEESEIDTYIGTIFININDVDDNYKNYTITKNEYFLLLLIHGLLHLLKYDHNNTKDALNMEKEERLVLQDVFNIKSNSLTSEYWKNTLNN